MFLFKCVLKLLINFALFFLLLLVYICVGVEIVTLMQDCNTYMTVIYMQFSGLYDHYWMICLYKINLCGNIPVKQQELRFRVVRWLTSLSNFTWVWFPWLCKWRKLGLVTWLPAAWIPSFSKFLFFFISLFSSSFIHLLVSSFQALPCDLSNVM